MTEQDVVGHSNLIEMKNCAVTDCSQDDRCLPERKNQLSVKKSVVSSEEMRCLSDEKDLQTIINEDAAAVESGDGVDTAYGWIIVTAAFVNCFIVGIMFIGFSMLYIAFDEHFQTSKAVSGWIGSLFLATGNICGIVFSVFVNRYGCRTVAIVGGLTWFVGFGTSSMANSIGVLYFTYGILAGMGFNMVVLTSFIIVQQHFKKRRAIAAAIAACGISIGSLSSGPVIGALLNAYHWRGTLLIMSAIALNNCAFGALYSPVKISRRLQASVADQGVKKRTSLRETLSQLGHDLTNLSLFSNTAFTLICLGTCLMNIGLTAFFQHTPSRANALGIEQYSLLPMINGIATAVARIFGGVIGNMSFTNRLLQYGISVIVGGSLLVILGLVVTFELVAVIGSAVAFCAGCYLTIQPTAVSDVVGIENFGKAQAFVLLFTGVGALVSVPLAGFIFDKTGNYNIPFYVGGIIKVIGGSLVVIAAVIQRRQLVTLAK